MHVIAIVNRKGGSGKTTTAFNLTGALAEREYRVLAVDLDPQGSLSRQEYGDLVFQTVIPHSIKAKEAMEVQQPYVFYDPRGRHSLLADRYRELATEIVEICRGER